jgi:prepilin-type N-terminal cleavage/methylation domain-containing protein
MIDRDRRGFTLIEMLIVVVIVAILGAIAYGRFNRPSLSALVVPDSVVAPQSTGRFVIQVENGFGRPKGGVPVVFRVIDGSGTISPEVVETDSAGAAGAQWIASSVGGLNAFAASVGESDWDRMQMTVTVRVDPSLGAGTTPGGTAAPGAVDTGATGADTAAPRRDTGAGSGTPPAGTSPRDTAGAAPPAGWEREDGGASDSASTRLPRSTTPLWAQTLLERITVNAED